MLQAHSLLWHYLWVAPNILLLVLSLLIWKRGLQKQFPAFFAFALFNSLGHLAVYAADIVPSVTPENFWRVDWGSLIVGGILKFAVVGEIFAHVFGSYASLARVGRLLIRGFGATLVLAATLAAAYTPKDGLFGIVSGAHLLEQTIYLIEAGLLVFIFLLSSYFRLAFSRHCFGITLGLSISACVHLATWAIMANGVAPNSARHVFDFLNMATYHVCVLIWYYYLLVPGKIRNERKDPPQSALVDPPLGPPTSEDLDVLNEEMERLLHR
jgi:hypothetical protein